MCDRKFRKLQKIAYSIAEMKITKIVSTPKCRVFALGDSYIYIYTLISFESKSKISTLPGIDIKFINK